MGCIVFKPNRTSIPLCVLGAFIGVLTITTGCGNVPTEANTQESRTDPGGTPVDAAIARTGTLQAPPQYTGTTAPVREVSVRSQVAAQVLSINVDVGDAVRQGQTLARLDDTLLASGVNQAQAELASLNAAVARARNQVSNAQALVEQSRLELQQAQADLARQQQLFQEGAVTAQQAEQARTEAQTAAQILRAAQEQVRTEQQAVAAAQSQVEAQQAVVAQAQRQRSYATLTAPISGRVMQRLTEVGNLVQPNGEIIRIGDFSRIDVNVQVSELELAQIQPGQSVVVRLDAFPNQTFTGQVNRISPAANQTARLVPVQVTIPNSNGRIGSGLLARVEFTSNQASRVVVPQSAIAQPQDRSGTIFVIAGDAQNATVTARTVKLGESADGQVEVLSGLQPGEQFVARSGRPLKDGEPVRFSILSEVEQGS